MMTVMVIWALTPEPSVAKAPMVTVPPRRPVMVAEPSALPMMLALPLLTRQSKVWATSSVVPSLL